MASSLNRAQWQHRLQSPRDNRTRSPMRPEIPPDHASDVPDREEPIDPLTATFQARYAALEKSLPALFSLSHPCCVQTATVELAKLEVDAGGANNSSAAVAPPITAARRDEDDDYDFDEDEEDEPKTATLVVAPPPVKRTASDEAKEPQKTAAATREKLEADRKAVEDAAKRALPTMFFTLENDRDAMLEQEKLDESDRQVNAEANAAPANVAGTLSSANLGASSLTLKHLIARIDQKRERVQTSDMELRSLMSEVRRNRSKWASEEKIGQEELYEAAEKVILELRAMTEHSTAFLSRVNKREAPDYYQIIKHPMDLSLVMKKLKSYQYKSKDDFVGDLNLIWSNCLKYNADPSHYLRKHAKAMQKATQSLEPLIPNIVIRDRAEVEAEEAGGAAEADAEGESDDEPIMSTRGRKGPGTKTRKGAPQPRDSTPDVKPPLFNLTRADSNPPGNDSQPGINGFPTPGGGTPVPNGISQMEIDHDKIDDDTGDVEYQAWKKITKKGRAKVASARHRLFRGDRLNLDEPGFIRSRTGMGARLREMQKHIKGVEAEGEEEADDSKQLAEEEEEEDKPLVPDYYDMQSIVPELPWQNMALGDTDMDIMDENLQLGPSGLFVAPDSKLNQRVNANMRQIQDTRKICNKIAVIKQMSVQAHMYLGQFKGYDPQPFVEQDAPQYILPSAPGPIMAPETSRAALQRSLGKICYQEGFEEFQPTAIDAITDVAIDYMQKLGKTLLTYQESPLCNTRFTPEEILLHALEQNGTELESIEAYIRDDVERKIVKLGVMHERMKSHLADLLRPALADTGGDDSKHFADGSSQFIGGDFAEDIGDDFFGFRELGLDVEFGLSSMSVPLHLLQNNLRSLHAPVAASSSTDADRHRAPAPFEGVTRGLLESQIGIVRGWFEGRFTGQAVEEQLVEDEELPIKQRMPKPRLPPSGKISMPRKRPVVGKKKRKVPVVQGEKKGGVKMEKERSEQGIMSPESMIT